MHYMYILFMCLLAGLGFAALATWLMTTKGNTIRDVLAAKNLKDANAIQLEILNKIKITSNLPIVGLFVIGAFVAVGLPAYIMFIQSKGGVLIPTVYGEIQNYLQLVNPRKGEKVYVYFPEMNIHPDGKFGIPLSNEVQSVLFESPNTNPLTIRLRIKPLENRIEVRADAFGNDPKLIPLDGKVANLPQPLKMARASSPLEEEVKNNPSPEPSIKSQEFKSVPDIMGGIK